MTVIKTIKERLHRRFDNWLDRRVPPSRQVTLDQRRIFIFPSRPGLWFGAVLLVMLIAAINYQNNMAFALVFLLSSVFIVAILHTYANLSGLTITAVRATPAYAGDLVEFELLISRCGRRDYYDITLSWGVGATETVTLKDIGSQTVKLHLPVHKRGLFTPGRLLIETFYPLGLLRAWTWIAPDLQALVYPRPIAGKKIQFSAASDDDYGDVTPIAGSDDFCDFRNYHPGDSLKHVLWKSYAKGQALQTKQYQSYAQQRLWLEWSQFVGDIEHRLSQLCYWVLKLDKENDDYGLRLPGIEIKPASGERHKAEVLKALALFSISSGQTP